MAGKSSNLRWLTEWICMCMPCTMVMGCGNTANICIYTPCAMLHSTSWVHNRTMLQDKYEYYNFSPLHQMLQQITELDLETTMTAHLNMLNTDLAGSPSCSRLLPLITRPSPLSRSASITNVFFCCTQLTS